MPGPRPPSTACPPARRGGTPSPARPALHGGDTADTLDHQADWAAHVAAGRIGGGARMTVEQVERVHAMERMLGLGRVGRW